MSLRFSRGRLRQVSLAPLRPVTRWTSGGHTLRNDGAHDSRRIMHAAKLLLLTPVLPEDVLATARVLEEQGFLARLITRGVTSPLLARFLGRSKLGEPFSRRPSSPVPAERTSAKW